MLSDIHRLNLLEIPYGRSKTIEELCKWVPDLKGHEVDLLSLSTKVLDIILSHVKFSNDLNQRLSKEIHTTFLQNQRLKAAFPVQKSFN